MKTIYLKLLLIVMNVISVHSQSDTTIFIKEMDFSFFRLHKVKYQSTGETKIEKKIFDLEDVRSLTFLNNDSLALSKHKGITVYTRLDEINEVSKYKYCFNPFLGLAIGAVGTVALVGGIAVTDVRGGAMMIYFRPFVTLIVASIGGYIGYEIANSINHDVLELNSVPDKYKKGVLIKFLRQK